MEDPETYEYNERVQWQKDKMGILTTGNHVTLACSPPPEFGGQTSMLTPEDALVSSEATCMMITFMHYVKKVKMELVSLNIDAKGTMEEVEKDTWAISRIHLYPRIVVKHQKDEKKAERAMTLAKKNCVISNSIKAEVVIHPEVTSERVED